MKKNVISISEASDLLQKMFSERIPVQALFVAESGARVRLAGLVHSITREEDLVISTAPGESYPVGYIKVPFFDEELECTYGDKRELPEQEREMFAQKWGESALTLQNLESGDMLILFFTP